MEYMESLMQNQLEASLAFEKQCEDIIYALDNFGRDTCPVEYGLPSYGEHMDTMKELVRDILMGEQGQAEGFYIDD